MRLSSLFGVTLRESSAGAGSPGRQLLLRAGFVRALGAGRFAYLPLAHRTLTNLERLLREALADMAGQEMRLPATSPAEAAIAELGRSEARSHRQLPRLVFHIGARRVHGADQAHECIALEAFGLAADDAGAQAQYDGLRAAWQRAFQRCALPVEIVEAGLGDASGHSFVYLTPAGEDELVTCPTCGYAAERQAATFRKPPGDAEPLRPIEKVATPDAKTIEALAGFLGISRSKTAKAVFLVAKPDGIGGADAARFIFVVIRGDMEVSAAKLAAALGASALRPATEEEIRAIGATPGYASPVGLAEKMLHSPLPVVIVADDAVPASPNLVAGANEPGYHLLHTNYGRDYTAHIVADIAMAGAGDACPRCGAPLRLGDGVTVGGARRRDARHAEASRLTYLAADGAVRPVMVTEADVNISRLMACIAEAHHDDHGLIWPPSVAPYAVHLVALSGRDSDALAKAEAIYHDLQRAEIETLFDDRPESPGVKFADADLIGLPLRITVAPKSLAAGGVEFKRRDAEAREIVPLDSVVRRAQETLSRMVAEVAAGAWRARTRADEDGSERASRSNSNLW